MNVILKIKLIIGFCLTIPGLSTDAYTGVEARTPPNLTKHSRDPLTSDRSGFRIGDFWLNISDQRLYVLFDNPLTGAIWIQLGSATHIITLTGNSGGMVEPDGVGNIDIIGSNGVDIVGTLNTLTVNDTTSLSPYVVDQSGNFAYATIQAAIDQAVVDGAATSSQKTIFIRGDGGTVYGESLVLSDGINLIGVSGTGLRGAITVSGTGSDATLTLQTNGVSSVKNLSFTAQAGQDIIVNPNIPTGTIEFDALECSFNTTIGGGNSAYNVNNNGSGQSIVTDFIGSTFKGGVTDITVGQGVTYGSTSNTLYEGTVKGLNVSSGATVKISDYSISAHSTIDSSTVVLSDGVLEVSSGVQPAIATSTSGITTIRNSSINATGLSSIDAGVGTTVEILFTSLLSTAPATEVISGSGSITKSVIPLLSVTAVSPTLTFTTPLTI